MILIDHIDLYQKIYKYLLEKADRGQEWPAMYEKYVILVFC